VNAKAEGNDGGRDAVARLEDLLGQQDTDPESPEPTAAGGESDIAAPVEADTDRGHDDPGDAVHEEAAAPEAPLFALLSTIERQLTVERIDRVWIFPPRRLGAGETAVVVVSVFPILDPDRRTVYAAHYTAPADAADPRLALQEFGTAPTERVGRIVEDVVGRLKDEVTAAPTATRVEGDLARWLELRHRLAEQHLDQTTRHPRLRTAPPDRPGPA
jgi:hypothetical protein